MKISAIAFEIMTGYKPENDDLQRVNCEEAGTIGHWQCGWCKTHMQPIFECGINCRLEAPK